MAIRTACRGLLGVCLLGLLVGWGCRRTDPELAAELRKEVDGWFEGLPKVPDAENGALEIMKGTAALDELPLAMRRYKSFDPRKAEEAEAVRGYLERNREAIRTIEKGLGFEKFTYIRESDRRAGVVIPSIQGLRYAAQIFFLKGQLAAADGLTAKAAEEYGKSVSLGVSLSRDPFLVTSMVSHAICRVGLDPLMALLSTPPSSPSEPEAILKALLRLQARRGSLRDGLDGEYFGFQLKELARVAAGESDFRSDFREDYAILKQWRAFYLNANPARFHEAPPEVREQRVEEKLGMADRKDAVFSKVALPSLGKTIVAAACHEAVWRGVLTLAAVRLFQAREGRLPKDLAELGSLVPEDLRTDPFTGKPLLYAPAGESFLLYSAGVNCRDDWGRASFLAHEDSYLLAGQADIVFHKP